MTRQAVTTALACNQDKPKTIEVTAGLKDPGRLKGTETILGTFYHPAFDIQPRHPPTVILRFSRDQLLDTSMDMNE
jgi:hypothetical protein